MAFSRYSFIIKQMLRKEHGSVTPRPGKLWQTDQPTKPTTDIKIRALWGNVRRHFFVCKLKYLKALNIITLQNYLVMYEVYTTNIFKLKDLRPNKLACSLLPSCLNVFLRQKFNGIIFSVCQHHQYKFSKNQFTSLSTHVNKDLIGVRCPYWHVWSDPGWCRNSRRRWYCWILSKRDYF